MNGDTDWRISLVLVLLFAAGASAACSRGGASSAAWERTGSVQFDLLVRTNVFVNVVTYKITGNGIVPITGRIDVSSSNSARAAVSGIPAGAGYVLELTAVSTDGKTNCLGMATFTVVEAQSAQATLVLQCKGPGAGNLTLAGTFDNCPILNAVMAVPMSAPLTGAINVQATATDPDGDALTYLWTQSPASPMLGVFTKDSAANTTFNCLMAGTSTLTVSASDGSCNSKAAMTVCCGQSTTTCASVGAGGAGGAGQSGSGGNGTGGFTVGTGGAGTGGAPGIGGQWTDGQGIGGQGNSGITTGGASAGSGGVGLGGNAGLGAGGRAGSDAVGGNGMGGTAGAGGVGGSGPGGNAGVGGAGRGGGAGGGTAGSGVVCSATTPPSHCVSAACEQCTMDNCFSPTDGCDLITDPVDKRLCEDAYACFVAPTHPGSSTPGSCLAGGDPTRCWCGTKPTTCLTDKTAPNMANGPCLMQVILAAHQTAATYDPGTIKLHFVDPAFPVGRAVNLSSCRGSFCGSVDSSGDAGKNECRIPEYVPSSP